MSLFLEHNLCFRLDDASLSVRILEGRDFCWFSSNESESGEILFDRISTQVLSYPHTCAFHTGNSVKGEVTCNWYVGKFSVVSIN